MLWNAMLYKALFKNNTNCSINKKNNCNQTSKLKRITARELPIRLNFALYSFHAVCLFFNVCLFFFLLFNSIRSIA